MHNPRRGSIPPVAIAGILVLVAVLGLGLGYYSYQSLHKTVETNTTANVAVTNTTTENTNTANVNTSVNTNVVANANANTNTTTAEITWLKAPVKITNPKLIDEKKSADYCLDNTDSTYYRVGTYNRGKYAGDDILLAEILPQCPENTVIAHFVKTKTGYVVLTKESSDIAGQVVYIAGVSQDKTTSIADLDFSTTLQGPKTGETLTLDSSIAGLFASTGLTTVFTDSTYGAVYMSKVAISPDTADTNSNTDLNALSSTNYFYTRNGFYVRALDGTVRVYYLQPAISTTAVDRSTMTVPLSLTWSDASTSKATYNLAFFSGCGAVNYANVVKTGSLSVTADLKAAGTANGQTVYELKNTNSTILKKFYNETTVYTSTTGQSKQLSYSDFLAAHPILYWVDPFGRMIEFTNAKFTPLAECGKPVIYLYPKTTTPVDVTLQPQGGFTHSEPVYRNGWHVIAQPNGQLTETSTGAKYPYLFWEGRGGLYTPTSLGFLVTQANMHTFLNSKLHQLGLNDQETSDFIAFWEPRMQGSPYYVVSFYGKATMDQLAPLHVSPKPDTTIRVLMDYHPVSAPVTVHEPRIVTPTRTGFTVVEWGGVLR